MLLELSSYIYLSAVLFRSLLGKELDNFSKSFDSFDDNMYKHDKIEKEISIMDKLRIRAIYIKRMKYQFFLYLWENTDLIFDKILEDAWQTERELYTKIDEEIEFLDSMYKYLQDRKQNKLNSKISNGLSLLQIMSIPLAIAFALLTWSNDNVFSQLVQNEKSNVFALQIIYALFGALVLSIFGCLYIYKKYLRLIS